MELKPCKCGGQAHVWVTRIGSPKGYVVSCEDCRYTTRLYKSKENAIKAWNDGNVKER